MSTELTAPGPSLDLPSLCHAITEHAPLPIATVEGATHIVRYANPAFCTLMSEPAEMIVGKPLSELLPEKDECITLLDRVFRERKPRSHIEEENTESHAVFWSYTMWPVLEDEGLVGVMLQVTETAKVHANTLAMNEALLLGSIRQHRLTEAAENVSAQLRSQVSERESIAAELAEKGAATFGEGAAARPHVRRDHRARNGWRNPLLESRRGRALRMVARRGAWENQPSPASH